MRSTRSVVGRRRISSSLSSAGEHPLQGENCERRDVERLPLDPTWLVDRCDRAFHDVRIESRAQTIGRHLHVLDPDIDDGIAAQVASGRLLIGEGCRPGREVPPQTCCLCRIIAPGDMPFEHHQPLNEVWVRGTSEERSVSPHRLADHHAAPSRHDVLDHGDDVVHEGLARQVGRPPSAASVSALVHEQHPEGVRQRVGSGQPLPRASGKPVKQQQRWPFATEIGDRDRCIVANYEQTDAARPADCSGAIAAICSAARSSARSRS